MKKHNVEKHDAARSRYHMYGHTLLRVIVGLLFIIAGYGKLQNPTGVATMLEGIGIFASMATFWAWVLIISELLFGALIFIGYKIRYTAWPLAIILAIAVITITIPDQGWNSTGAFFHYISIASLISLSWTGPGAYALSESR